MANYIESVNGVGFGAAYMRAMWAELCRREGPEANLEKLLHDKGLSMIYLDYGDDFYYVPDIYLAHRLNVKAIVHRMELQGFSGIRDLFKEPEYVDVAKGYPILENPADGDGWVQLLKSDSSRTDCREWGKLDGWNWAELLAECPQFADRCDWSKLNAYSWSYLLAATNAFDVRCDFSIFNGVEWIFVLKHRSDLAPRLDWSILNDRDTARIKKILGMPL